MSKRSLISHSFLLFLIFSFTISLGKTFLPAANANSVVRDSLIKPLSAFAVPVFTNPLNGSVNYDQKFVSIIQLKSPVSLGTQITVTSKPEWLNVKSEFLVSVLAGGMAPAFANGSGNTARFAAPYAITCDSRGVIYVADQVDNRIRKISPGGEVSTVVGSITAGFKDGKDTEAMFDSPSGIAIDKDGNLYISDQENNSIRKISAEGIVSTLAGNQKAGYANGEKSNASFKSPAGICVDNRGYVYVADRGNNRIRVISPQGIVSTLAGSGQAGFAEGRGSVAKFNAPTGLAVDSRGYVYVTDQVNNRVRKISTEGDVTTLAGNGEFSSRDGEGNQSSFRYPTGITLDPQGNIYITDQLNQSIRRISPLGIVVTLSGGITNGLPSGTPASAFLNPTGICLDNEGKLYVADYQNYNIKSIAFSATLFGTPDKSQVGVHQVALKATNEFGTTMQEGRITVKDNVGPKIVSTIPANLAFNVDRTSKISIQFDEEIALADSGSVNIYNNGELIRQYKKANAGKDLSISDDLKSLVLDLKDLPAGAALSVFMGNGVVRDKANNPFEKTASLASFAFNTKSKEKQNLELLPLTDKNYGDAVFKIGPMYSSNGLLLKYTAEDPKVLFVYGDSARILKAGTTNVMAFLAGDDNYLPVQVSRSMVVNPKFITIRPNAGGSMSYGGLVPLLKYEIVSGSLERNDVFTGQLGKAKGDSIGVYAITIGSLSLGNNYEIKMEGSTMLMNKAVLVIGVANQTKTAGMSNPVFISTYEGFVNGEGPRDLNLTSAFTCTADERSFIGAYSINQSGAVSKNYTISYLPGVLNIIAAGSSTFNVQHSDLLENTPAGAVSATLSHSGQADEKSIFRLVSGEGDTDNASFKITGSSVSSERSFDYETKHNFSIRVKSDGLFGESSSKIITILLTDVNERPEMKKLSIDAICLNGELQLTGITAGPESDQLASITVQTLGSKGTMQVSQPVNGISTLRYALPENSAKTLNFRITVKDNGGLANGGIDSTVYNYTVNVVPQTAVRILSDKGNTLLRGASSSLSVNGSGKVQWYFNKQKIAGGQNNVLRFTALESGSYSVRVTSEGGCISESNMLITVSDTTPVTCTNMITANYDGLNDAFIVRNIEYYPANELSIVDKLGKVVFSQKNYANDWTGTFHGSALPAGTYYYVLSLGGKAEKVKGFISLVN